MFAKKMLYSSMLSLVLGFNCSEMILGMEEGSELCVTSQKETNILSPTLAHMKAFLGEDFVDGQDSLEENVRRFWGNSKFTPHNCLGLQHIELDDSLCKILCDLIKYEQAEYEKGNIVLYHGTSGKTLFMYQYYAALFSKLEESYLGDFILRGEHFWAIDPTTGLQFKTINDFRNVALAHYGPNAQTGCIFMDFFRSMAIGTLHCNVTLSAGPGTSLSSASSVGFLCNSFRATSRKLEDLLSLPLLLRGMPKDQVSRCGAEIKKLFKEFYCDNQDKNGGILAISVPRDKIDELAMSVWMGGRRYNPSIYKLSEKICSILKIVDPTQKDSLCKWLEMREHFNQDELIAYLSNSILHGRITVSDFEKKQLSEEIESYFADYDKDSSLKAIIQGIVEASEKKLQAAELDRLTNEVILYLHPDVKFHIYGTYRYQLDEVKSQQLKIRLNELVDDHIGRLRAVDNESVVSRFIEYGYIQQAAKLIDDSSRQNPQNLKQYIGNVLQAMQKGFIEVLDYWEQSIIREPMLTVLSEREQEVFRYVLFDIIKPHCLSNILKTNTQFLSNLKKDIFSHMLLCFSYDDKLVETLLKANQGNVELFAHALFHNEEYINPQSMPIFIKYGFSFDPNSDEGRKHLESWIDCVKQSRFIKIRDNAQITACIMKCYQSELESHEDLRQQLLKIIIQALYNGCDAYVNMNDGGYSVTINRHCYQLPWQEVDLLSIPTNTNSALLARYLTHKLKRTYSTKLVEKFCKLQTTMYEYYIDMQSPASHTWLDLLKTANNFEEAEALIDKLDSLNIVFLNLGIMDNFQETKDFVRENAIVGEEKQCAEDFVNQKMIDYLEKQIDIWKRCSTMERDSHNTEKSMPVYMRIAYSKSHCLSASFGLDIFEEIWKYNLHSRLPICMYTKDDNVGDRLERIILSNPALWQNESLVRAIVLERILLERFSDKYSTELEEGFFRLSPFDQCITIIHSDLRNDFIKRLAERVWLPNTDITLKEAISILQSYNLLQD